VFTGRKAPKVAPVKVRTEVAAEIVSCGRPTESMSAEPAAMATAVFGRESGDSRKHQGANSERRN
jgi:hypothetical protein